MSASGRIPSVLCVVLCSLLILAFGSGCDTLGIGSDDEAVITARAETPDGSLIEDSRVTFISNDDSTTKIATDGIAKTTYEKSSQPVTVIGNADGRRSAKKTVPDRQSNHTVTLVLEENPDQVALTFSATATDADTAAAADYYVNDTLAAEKREEVTVSVPFQKEPVPVRVEAEHLASASKEVRPDSNKSVSFALDRESVPVTLLALAAGADSAVAADYYANGNQVATRRTEAKVVLDYQPDPTPLEAEAPHFKTGRKELQPAANQKIVFELERKSVELTVIPRKALNELVIDSAKTTIHEPYKRDSMEVAGKTTVELPQRSGQRLVVTRAITKDPENNDLLDRYDPVENLIAADADRDLSPILEKLPACNDGISNDPKDDGLVDVARDVNGDPAVETGKLSVTGDPGCPTADDDDERHIVATTSTLGSDTNQFVSNAKPEWEDVVSQENSLDESIHDAVGGILLGQDVKKESDESGEEFALRIETGAKNNLTVSNMTEIYPDQDTSDSKHFARFTIHKDWFGNKPHEVYRKVTAVHARKIRSEPSGDGGGKVYFMKKTGDDFWVTFFSWAVEREDFNGFENNTAKLSTQGAGRRVRTGGYPGIP